jgi:hypothetical protein
VVFAPAQDSSRSVGKFTIRCATSITFRKVLLLRFELIWLLALCGYLDSSHQSLYLLLSKTLLSRRLSTDIQHLFSFPLIAFLSFLHQSKITLACPTT